jgi:hypothetical protein
MRSLYLARLTGRWPRTKGVFWRGSSCPLRYNWVVLLFCKDVETVNFGVKSVT